MLSFNDVLEAENTIKGKLHRTPIFHSETFSDMFNADVYFKMETFQKTGSFKTRGAFVKFASLTDEEKRNGVITASAGNHAQGVAYAGQYYNIDAKIVMPEATTPAKINAVEDYGGHVVLFGNSYDEAHDYAIKLGIEEKRTFIEAYNDEMVIAGQSTIGKEIMDDINPDIIIAPIGGGGLISGIAFAAKNINKNVEIIGVESEKANSMELSIQEKYILGMLK